MGRAIVIGCTAGEERDGRTLGIGSIAGERGKACDRHRVHSVGKGERGVRSASGAGPAPSRTGGSA
eukprot:501280-Rhodomonas_salina.1